MENSGIATETSEHYETWCVSMSTKRVWDPSGKVKVSGSLILLSGVIC